MGLLIAFFVLSIFFSFLCSILEAVLLSITPSYVSIKEQEGSSIADELKELKEDIDRPLSAILTLNTIAHTVGAIGVGAAASKIWADNTVDIFGLPLSYEAIVATLMTLAILIFSEIIPKTIGANNWKSLTPFTVRALKFLGFVLMPFVWISQLITKTFKKEKNKSVLSRADFFAMTEIAKKEGVFREGESRIMQNLLRFEKIRVKDVMTPRTVFVASPQGVSIEEFYNKNENLRFSRIPIYEGTTDNITGYFLKDEFLLSMIKKHGDQPLSSIRRDIIITKDTTPIPQIFNQLMEKREHLALAIDEFGGTVGLVTMEDIIETLLGMEILDEIDNVADMQSYARKKWEDRAKRLGLITEES